MGYVNACAWSECGTKLAFVSQSARVTLVTFGQDDHTVCALQTGVLPMTAVLIEGDCVYGAGHDRTCYKMPINDTELAGPEEVQRATKTKKKKARNQCCICKISKDGKHRKKWSYQERWGQ